MFLRLWPTICDCIERGYSVREVHAACVAEGWWPSGYSAFWKHLKRARREQPNPDNIAAQRVGQRERGPTPTHLAQAPSAGSERAASKIGRLQGHPALKDNPLMKPIERDPYHYKPSEDTKDLY